jgi:hypothetical protein
MRSIDAEQRRWQQRATTSTIDTVATPAVAAAAVGGVGEPFDLYTRH